MAPPHAIAALVFSPFVLALLAPWLIARFPRSPRLLSAWPLLITAALAMELRSTLGAGARLIDLPWAPSLGLSLSLALDGLGLLFALLISGVGTLVVLYASRYLEGDAHTGRFYAWLFAFMGAMLGVALSDNVITLFVFWELTSVTSFLLIGFDHEREEARAAALQALIVTGLGGLALLAAGVLLLQVSGTASLSAMAASRASIAGHPLYGAIAGLALAAAFTKSAQVPAHFWLPNAMVAPTPVSAYLHSATMVKAGVYLVARMTPVLGGTAGWTTTVTVVGAATMAVGAYRAVQETDLKRVLAYSTISALGVLTMLLGIGTSAAISAALTYLAAHACYKGALFLVAGAVDHGTGTRDVRLLSGLRRAMPLTAAGGALAALSMAGVPLTLGFVGKDAAYEALLGGASWWQGWLLVLLVLSSVLLGLAGLLAGLSPFRGTAAGPREAHEPRWEMWGPSLLLAVAGAASGFVPSVFDRPLSAAASAVLASPVSVSLAAWHGLTPALALSALTLCGVGGAYLARTALRTRSWTPWLGPESLYRAILSGLDAAGRLAAPPLYSGPLRSYVAVIVVTLVMLAGVALATGPALAALTPRTNILAHELLVVGVVVAGAVAAVRARSTMAAVLSLGTVGYGIAVIFLLFGGPDLAMTQFSVETLTAVIFVLVFRHFRTLQERSPRSARYRDAVIAVASGTLVGILVLSVATSETAPELREYFARFAPTLGHGRNVVNVILVDFRAFDTMGEITVLATAAIGVWAVLGVARAADARVEAVSGLPASPIFRTGARLLMPLLLLFSVFLLLRGHNQPGGGFVGGLVAAAAFALYGMAYGVARARRALMVRPLTLLGTGLVLALLSGVPAALRGSPFLTALWSLEPVAVGTPVVFDIGVFLVVAGVVLLMVFSLAEEP